MCGLIPATLAPRNLLRCYFKRRLFAWSYSALAFSSPTRLTPSERSESALSIRTEKRPQHSPNAGAVGGLPDGVAEPDERRPPFGLVCSLLVSSWHSHCYVMANWDFRAQFENE